jgi:hypothetical protein
MCKSGAFVYDKEFSGGPKIGVCNSVSRPLNFLIERSAGTGNHRIWRGTTVTVTHECIGVPDWLTKFPRNSLIREKKKLLIVTEFGNLTVSWKNVTLITKTLCVVLCSLEGSPPLESEISHSLL